MDLHEAVSRLKKLAHELGRTPTCREYERMAKVSSRFVRANKYSDLCRQAGLEPNGRPQDRQPIKLKPPRILAFDIETAPMRVWVFQLYGNDAIGLNQIDQDSFILSFAARFLDEDKVHYIDNRKARDKSNDERIIRKAHKLLKEADILLGHNIDRFDLKKLNARFILYDLDPIPKKQTIDTLKIAKRYFSFTSNKLEYLAKFLGCGEKMTNRKFDGLRLWTECLNNNQEAYSELELYNRMDVEVQIKVFERLKKYDHSLNFQAYTQQPLCTCGSTEFFKDGFNYTKNGTFQRYCCAQCGKGFSGKENLIHKDIRKIFFK